MWPYPWTHVGTPSHLGHMDRVAATMPSQAHAGAAQEAPDIGQWEGQDVPLVRPSSCKVKGGIPSSRKDTYLPILNDFDVYIPTLIGPTASQVRVMLVENQPARHRCPLRSPDTHTFFAHTLQVRYKSAYHPSMLRMCERVNISLVRADWKRIWEHERSRKERALASTRDWTTIGQSLDTIRRMLGCCPRSMDPACVLPHGHDIQPFVRVPSWRLRIHTILYGTRGHIHWLPRSNPVLALTQQTQMEHIRRRPPQ